MITKRFSQLFSVIFSISTAFLICSCGGVGSGPSEGNIGGIGSGLNSSATPGLDGSVVSPNADPLEVKAVGSSDLSKCYKPGPNDNFSEEEVNSDDCLIKYGIGGRVYLSKFPDADCCNERFLRLVNRLNQTYIDTQTKSINGVYGSFEIVFFSTLHPEVELYLIENQNFIPGILDTPQDCQTPACHEENWVKIPTAFTPDEIL